MSLLLILWGINLTFIRNHMKFFPIVFSCLVISNSVYANNQCLENRYVFDIGSGSTKSKAYLVDKCEGKIVKNIGEHNKAVHYHDCIAVSHDKKTITKQCLQDGYKAVKDIEAKYGIDCHKEKCAGIATAWSRDARNSDDLLDIFKKENIHILEVSQQAEGELGFKTAINDPEIQGIRPERIVSWDIGGGSMQLGTMHDRKIHIFEGDYGIIDFFHTVRTHFPKEGYSASKERYFGKDELDKILHFTANTIGDKVMQDKVIKRKLHQKDVKVVGIGRIMYLGIKDELGVQNPVKKEQIKALIYEFADISKEEAKQKFPRLPDYFVMLVQQALIIVYSVMESAGINELYIVDSTMTDQIAIDKTLWKE